MEMLEVLTTIKEGWRDTVRPALEQGNLSTAQDNLFNLTHAAKAHACQFGHYHSGILWITHLTLLYQKHDAHRILKDEVWGSARVLDARGATDALKGAVSIGLRHDAVQQRDKENISHYWHTTESYFSQLCLSAETRNVF